MNTVFIACGVTEQAEREAMLRVKLIHDRKRGLEINALLQQQQHT